MSVGVGRLIGATRWVVGLQRGRAVELLKAVELLRAVGGAQTGVRAVDAGANIGRLKPAHWVTRLQRAVWHERAVRLVRLCRHVRAI